MGKVIEVDQSGRTDVLAVDTVLAYSNSIRASLRIPVKAKREFFQELQARGIRRSFIGVKMFSAGLVLLLEPYLSEFLTIVIDVEYMGWDAEIKEHLIRRWRTRNSSIQIPQVVFRQIGKGSQAHHLGLAVFRGNQKATWTLNTQKTLRRLLKHKNRGRPVMWPSQPGLAPRVGTGERLTTRVVLF